MFRAITWLWAALWLATLPLQAQAQGEHSDRGLTAVTLNWAELVGGCEALGLEDVDLQQCLVQASRWQTDYQLPLQQPGLLVTALDQILAELPVQVEPDQSLWRRLLNWVFKQLGDDSVDVPGWLRDWEFPETFTGWLLGLSVGACVLMALVIVGHELLQVYRGRAIAHAPGAADGVFSGRFKPAIPTLAEVPTYPLQAQPGLLLHVVLHHLQQAKMLSRQAGRTHQDLLQQAPELGALGGSLADIALAAERSTYGDWQVSAAEIEALLAAGQRVVADAKPAVRLDER